MSRTRVAVVGAGFFGAQHIAAWRAIDDAELVAVVEPDPAKTVAGAPVFRTLERVDADLIDIATPPATHLTLIEQALGLAPWIICQKPFCGGLRNAEAAVRMAAAAGARLAVHENFRFQPWYRAVARVLAGGVLGQVHRARFTLRPGDGQGPEAYLSRQPYFQNMPRFLVHETAIHWIDVFRYLFGAATGVFARLERRNPNVAGEDSGVLMLSFDSGVTALFDGDRHLDHAAADTRRTMGEMLVEGTDATLRLDGAGRLLLRRFGELEEQNIPVQAEAGFGGGCVRLTCQAILTAFRAGEPAETDATAYLANQRIEAAIYDSAETGRWIDLGPDGTESDSAAR